MSESIELYDQKAEILDNLARLYGCEWEEVYSKVQDMKITIADAEGCCVAFMSRIKELEKSNSTLCDAIDERNKILAVLSQ